MFAMLFTCFCKCFTHMFQVFHLSSFVCCKYCIRMFQKWIGCCTWDAVGSERAPRGRTALVTSERCGTPRGRTKRRRMQAMSKRRGQSRGRKKQGGKRTAAVDIRPNVWALAAPTEEGFRRNQGGRSGSSRQVARRGKGEHCFTFF